MVIFIAIYSNANIFVIPYSTTKRSITILFQLENFQYFFSTIPLQPLTIQMDKSDGRTDEDYEWSDGSDGWLELKNDTYLVLSVLYFVE